MSRSTQPGWWQRGRGVAAGRGTCHSLRGAGRPRERSRCHGALAVPGAALAIFTAGTATQPGPCALPPARSPPLWRGLWLPPGAGARRRRPLESRGGAAACPHQRWRPGSPGHRAGRVGPRRRRPVPRASEPGREAGGRPAAPGSPPPRDRPRPPPGQWRSARAGGAGRRRASGSGGPWPAAQSRPSQAGRAAGSGRGGDGRRRGAMPTLR